MQLPRTTLGTTGLEVSRLALGGFHQVEISSEVVQSVVDAYIDHGGNYIETARGYGNGASEAKLGRAIAGKRDQLIVASKSANRTGDGIRKDLEESLRLLQTDHIDFYFLHGVGSIDEIAKVATPGGAVDALLQAKDQGLIKGIGFSSHRPWLYADALEQLPLSVILIWDNYLEELYLPEIQQQIYPLARNKGVGITAMKPLADGYLWKSATNAFRYALGSGSDVLVSGMNDPKHVEEAVAAVCAGPLNEEERLLTLTDAPELGDYVCRQCGSCSEQLKELFRLEGYIDRQMIDYLPHNPADYALRLRLSGWFGLAGIARERFTEMTLDLQAIEREATRVRCPYSIDVARKLRLTLAKLNAQGIDML